MIDLSNVEKSLRPDPGETLVRRRISAEMREGGSVTIMAPSGAGKCALPAVLGILRGGSIAKE